MKKPVVTVFNYMPTPNLTDYFKREIRRAREMEQLELTIKELEEYKSTDSSIQNAIFFLKQQLPKVIELSEICNHEVVWLEFVDSDCIPCFFYQYGFGKPFVGCSVPFTELEGKLSRHYLQRNDSYHKTWRCWDKKPTHEQRMATKWDLEEK